MGRALATLCSGALFGFGLVLAGMTNPAKVAGFLDVAGTWDPSLAFTMGGALLVTLFAFPWLEKRGTTAFGDALHLPTRSDIDVPLVAGAALFGLGWGIAGYCPGPAVASLGRGSGDAAIFLAAMVAGMQGKRWLLDPWIATRPPPTRAR